MEAVHCYNSPFLQKKNANDSSSPTTVNIKAALVVLNSPIRRPPSLVFRRLWELSSYRVCADGGANRLYEATVKDERSSSKDYIPDLIVGDLDSLKTNVRQYYETSKGTTVQRVPCQDTNDLDKALNAVLLQFSVDQKATENEQADDLQLYIYGAFGGRFDQEMGCIQALCKWSGEFHNRLILYDDHNVAFLLPSGTRNEIRLPFYGEEAPPQVGACSTVGEGPTCGLIPIGCRCESVVTTGLKWNLDGSKPLEFGGLVSTSNKLMEEMVTVWCSHPLVFTVEMSAG